MNIRPKRAERNKSSLSSSLVFDPAALKQLSNIKLMAIHAELFLEMHRRGMIGKDRADG